VHGGARFRDAVLVDDGVVAALDELTDLAPLHQPAALAGIAAVGRALPDVPAVACFDTAFHATLPAAAATYALPQEWRERFGLRRLASTASRTPTPRAAPLRRGWWLPSRRRGVAGGGARRCLRRYDQGLHAHGGSRHGDARGQRRSRPRAVAAAPRRRRRRTRAGIDREGGLRGLAGDADMRAVLARADDDAGLAVDVYVHRLRAAIAAMVAALGVAAVFTGAWASTRPRSARARRRAWIPGCGTRRGITPATADAEIGVPDAARAPRRHRARGPRGRLPGARPAPRSQILMVTRSA
jgi:acetate kinase